VITRSVLHLTSHILALTHLGVVTPVSYARGPGFEAHPRDRLPRILANYSNFSRITAELFVVQQFVYILLYMRNDEKWYFCVKIPLHSQV